MIDRTGLQDRYAAALQRAGLKLTPVKAPLDVIVIDHIERPAGN